MWENSAGGKMSFKKKAAELRDKTASKMTPAQIAEAQRLARAWKRKRP
jgi:hypothetical protein